MKRPKSRWIPQGYAERRDSESDAVVYVSPEADGWLAIGYHGKANNPDGYYRFRNAQERDKWVEKFFTSRRQHAQFKIERRATKIQRQQTELERCQVGAIYHTHWGYDQTNVEFFQVVAVSGKMATLQEIAQEHKYTGSMCGQCAPVPGKFIGQPERHLIQADGITIDQVRMAWIWDGKARYFSEYA